MSESAKAQGDPIDPAAVERIKDAVQKEADRLGLPDNEAGR